MSLRRLTLSVLLGLPLSLVTAEVVCRVVRDGAFPHVNFYVPDEALGVRLAPNATERISFSKNPVTTLRTNSRGYRGGEWPDAATPAVLVVGDSQVFGLGVEEDETASAVIAAATGKAVLNGGVPTYGPDEYLAVVEEIAAERTLSDIVLVYNASNDFFEEGRPNRERHGVWDGWAVRAENMPPETTDFPGRRWLYSQSHAMFAWRAWRHGDRAPDALPSEGKAADLLPLAREREKSLATVGVEARATEAKLTEQVRERLATAGKDTEWEMLAVLSYIDPEVSRGDLHLAAVASLEGRAVGDVVYEPFAESSRHITLTAEHLEAGAKLRREAPARLRAWIGSNPGDGYDVERARELLRALEVAAGRAGVEADGVAPTRVPRSALTASLSRAREIAAAEGARLTVVLLPLDVQVSDAEWAKYGAESVDLSGSLGLLDEVAHEADFHGVSVVAPLEALRAAEPGAFLDGDLHLSPKGQRVLGEAIAASLSAPPPVPMPGAGLGEGRSRVPLPEEWAAVRETVVRGSSALGCGTWRVREWLKVRCIAEGAGAITLVDAPLEAMVRTDATPSGSLTLLAPVLPGRTLVADFAWQDHAARLVVDDAGGRFERREGGTSEPLGTPDPALDGCVLPDGWIGTTARGCAALDGCEDRVACADGRRLALPTCAIGEANAGSAGHCFPRCDDAHPCAEGVCTPWVGSAVCL